eukprot:CAMPEP_0197516458 /NCGR_PEP_ID=MMETSP1318-20131121/1337_1 /TAXON_ID=552666 /ORGANISM="Partenskyella glossopodia, Strain RCC365" /LENGTH=77 /DNA_ID=CAMNT_0043065213 /DNA_START=324 /DNA_END=557 /DNA_ORIENTATION=+
MLREHPERSEVDSGLRHRSEAAGPPSKQQEVFHGILGRGRFQKVPAHPLDILLADQRDHVSVRPQESQIVPESQEMD